METEKIDASNTKSKQLELSETVSKKILFVLDYVQNVVYRENVSHVDDDDVADYVENKYG